MNSKQRTRKRRNAKPRNAREAEERDRALAVLARMRRDRLSLRAAAKAEEIDSRAVSRFVGSAIRQDKGGRHRATRYDRIPRTLNHLTRDGTVPVTVRDSRTASRLAEHSNAIRSYRRFRDPAVLAQFKGKSFQVGGIKHKFLIDPAAIDLLEDAGVLAGIESLYYAHAIL